jgi:linoleoyl-CoA desaturase
VKVAWLLFSLIFCSACCRYFLLSTFHTTSHITPYLKVKNSNNACFIAIYTIVGAHAEAWKLRHINSHHYAPNVEDYDSDLKITKLIRVIPNSEHKWYHRFQHIYAPFAYTMYSLFWVFIKDFAILYSADEYIQRKGLKYHISFWVQKFLYLSIILLFPLLFSRQIWYQVLVGFLLMHLTQSLFLLFTFFMTHHVEETEYLRQTKMVTSIPLG